MNAIVPTGNNALTPTSMESAIKLAEMMARGKLVPTHLHNSPGDCLMIVEQALRWQMSPFAVAQCTSVIQGRLMFEGKLVSAALNSSGILSSRLDYEFSGEKEQRAVTVRGTLKGETKPREVTVFLADAKTSNGMWVKQPDQQLVYAATRVWARRHAPEVMLGVYAPEEFDRAEPFAGPTLEAEAEAPSPPPSMPASPTMTRAAAAPTPRAERKVAPKTEVYDPNKLQSELAKVLSPEQLAGVEAWLAGFQVKLDRCQTRAELDLVVTRPAVTHNLENGPEAMQREMNAMIAAAYDRLPAIPRETPDDLEIVGADKLAAG